MVRYAAPSEPEPPATQWRDRMALPLTIMAALVVSGAGAWALGRFPPDNPPGHVVRRDTPLLPDLAIGPIGDLAVGTTPTGQQRLRFAATIVNIGQGDFVLRARRSWVGGDDWVVEHWIKEEGGGFSVVDTEATLVFGGDGHDHWHIKEVEAHQIESLEGEILARLTKQGFCFFDSDPYQLELPSAAPRPQWGTRGCGGPLDTRITMGLSIGWADAYPWFLLDELIEVTGFPDGQYRIRQIADPNNEFEELDETNNEVWVVIELGTRPDGLRTTTVVEEGPRP